MLKIKDNVDLKELEKFGFKKHKNDEKDVVVSKWVMMREYDDTTYSEKSYLDTYPIIELRKTLDNRLRIDISVSCYNLAFTIATDLLFDLIQAGLVEKV